MGIFLFLGGVVGFFYIPKFRISEISIEGANVLDKEQLKEEIAGWLKGKFFKIFPYDNIFLLPKEKIITSLLENFPILKKLDIERNFPQKIYVLIEERKPAAILCTGSTATSTDSGGPASTSASLGGESCVFMDENGFIFQPAPSFSGGIFVKFIDERQASSSPSGNTAIGKETITESELQKLLSFEKLLAGKSIGVSKIILKDGKEYEVYLKEGWHILLNSKNEPNSSFNNLLLILDSNVKEKRPKIEYVDLRFGNKVFYKFK